MIDYLIVGQGLAGTTLGLKLLKKGFSVKIIDDNHASSSSLIAGGVVHPMSFKRTILSWKADLLIPYAINFYQSIEEIEGCTLFYPNKMVRVITSIEEQNNWQGRMADSPLDEIIYDFIETLDQFPINNEFGLGGINLAGRLDVKLYLKTATKSFIENSILTEKQFDFNNLTISEDKVEYDDITAKNVIFCEGYKFIENPYFNYLPNNLTKGEILIIKSKNIPEVILSKGCFILPIGNDHFVLGATYRWNNFNSETSEEGKKELIDKIKLVGDFDFEIIEHRAGVRPTIPDRRPIIGTHPKYSSVHLFNGLGSKGVMIAPYYADQFIEHLTQREPLDPEVDLQRFSKKHLRKCLL